jgi:hypothetical protein
MVCCSGRGGYKPCTVRVCEREMGSSTRLVLVTLVLRLQRFMFHFKQLLHALTTLAATASLEPVA